MTVVGSTRCTALPQIVCQFQLRSDVGFCVSSNAYISIQRQYILHNEKHKIEYFCFPFPTEIYFYIVFCNLT